MLPKTQTTRALDRAARAAKAATKTQRWTVPRAQAVRAQPAKAARQEEAVREAPLALQATAGSEAPQVEEALQALERSADRQAAEPVARAVEQVEVARRAVEREEVTAG